MRRKHSLPHRFAPGTLAAHTQTQFISIAKSRVMKKYITPQLAQCNLATEGLMTMSHIIAPNSGTNVDGGTVQTFEKQFSIWGDDQSADESNEMDFNSTGIF